MKRLLLMFIVTAAMGSAMSATVASAAGLNLAWTNCASDGGTSNITFACNTNAGSRALKGSFVIDADLAEVNGNELVFDFVTSAPTLPDWWTFFKAGTCRQTALSIAAHNGTNCPDLFEGQASMNVFDFQADFKGPSTGRIKCVNAVQQAAIVTLFAGQEYGIVSLGISNTRTVGTPSCAGCDVTVCIRFNNAKITTEGDLNNIELNEAASALSNQITWQGSGADCSIVPTRNATWGAVKSLYR